MHVYLDNSFYFITCKTRDKKNHFLSNTSKQIILDNLNKVKTKFYLKELYFAILNNHYHLLILIKKGTDLPKIMQLINGNVSRALNLKLNYRLWDKYFDKIIETEKSYLKVIGYIIGNPLKHKIVNNFKELEKYKYCNFNEVINRFGKEGAIELVSQVKNLNWE
jgi:REP element-mobilizing transposase RayT